MPEDGLLKREHFTAERVQAYAEFLAKQGGTPLMSEDARQKSREAFRAGIAPGADLWVFGYGSLMWNPAIKVSESRAARIEGYQRRFCLTLSMGRGTPERPGLMLGLDEGGACVGVAHRIAAGDIDSELSVLWYREMLSGAYNPQWLDADIEGLGPRRALSFVIRRDHPRYEGVLGEEEIAARIAQGEGILGTNRDYLYRTASHLLALGVTEEPVHRLAEIVRSLKNEPLEKGTS